MATVEPMTWQAFAAIHDSGHRHELIRGEVVSLAWRYTRDATILSTIAAEIWHAAKRVGGTAFSSVGCLLARSPDTVRWASACYVSAGRWERERDGGRYVEGAPEFVVELPPRDKLAGYTDEKVAEWLAAGARIVWVVDVEGRSVVVHRSDVDPTAAHDGDTLDGGDVVPGFTLPVAAIFE